MIEYHVVCKRNIKEKISFKKVFRKLFTNFIQLYFSLLVALGFIVHIDYLFHRLYELLHHYIAKERLHILWFLFYRTTIDLEYSFLFTELRRIMICILCLLSCLSHKIRIISNSKLFKLDSLAIVFSQNLLKNTFPKCSLNLRLGVNIIFPLSWLFMFFIIEFKQSLSTIGFYYLATTSLIIIFELIVLSITLLCFL